MSHMETCMFKSADGLQCRVWIVDTVCILVIIWPQSLYIGTGMAMCMCLSTGWGIEGVGELTTRRPDSHLNSADSWSYLYPSDHLWCYLSLVDPNDPSFMNLVCLTFRIAKFTLLLPTTSTPSFCSCLGLQHWQKIRFSQHLSII